MSDYGYHPTQYGSLPNNALYSMYRESTFACLSESEKLGLLQETVNRDSWERGMKGSPRVSFADLPPNVGGQASNGVIEVNRDMAVNRCFSFKYNGQTVSRPLTDANLQALNTSIHENIHCWQDQINDGTIVCNDVDLAAQYHSNDFTTSAVLSDNGYKPGSQYLTGETPAGYYMYYFQSTERDAFRGAEEKTNTIIQSLEEEYGSEKSFAEYSNSIKNTGYAATEKRAAELFQNPSFEKDLNQTLSNHYYGTSIPVDSNTENAVKAEMIVSYQSLTAQESVDNANTSPAANGTATNEISTNPIDTCDLDHAADTDHAPDVDNSTCIDAGEDCEDGLDL